MLYSKFTKSHNLNWILGKSIIVILRKWMVLEWSETPRDCASGILNNYLSHFGSPLHSKSNLRASEGLLGHYLYQDDAQVNALLDLLIFEVWSSWISIYWKCHTTDLRSRKSFKRNEQFKSFGYCCTCFCSKTTMPLSSIISTRANHGYLWHFID